MSESYTYAVARIRANELALFNDQAIEQLLAAKSYEECIRLLQDKGWGGMEANPTAEPACRRAGKDLGADARAGARPLGF